MTMFGIKTKAAAKRGVEAAASAFVSALAFAYIDDDGQHTATSFVHVIRDNADAAGGLAILSLLVTFGYTRSKAPNLSPVAENVPPPDGPLIEVKDDEAVAEAEAAQADVPPPDEVA